jgi:homoserine dehydrogenase
LSFVGFGNVGRALGRLLLRKRLWLQERYGLDFMVTGIYTARHGAAIDPAGLDLEAAIARAEADDSLEVLSAQPAPAAALDFIAQCPADVLFENSPVNYTDGEPAVTHLRAALNAGMHAVTANKGPVVHAYHSLSALARQVGRRFYFESTVMDGAPIFSLFRGALPGARLLSFKGVLNSTTNLILSRMESGESFERAVAYAQEMGIAETDPSGDIDGWDAAIKVAALATVLMDTSVKPQDIRREGIRAITPEMTRAALAEGQRYKLICSARREGETVVGEVAPERVAAASPFYSVSGTTSLMQFETDTLGRLTIIEEDPGPHTTAYGLLADWLNASAQA